MVASLRISGRKNEIVRDGPRHLYHIPEADALGLENRAEASRVKYQEDCQTNESNVKRFGSIAARPPKTIAPSRDILHG